MDPQIQQPQLTYLSIKPIIQYSTIAKRRTLVKSIPSLRAINKKAPYCFDEVVLVMDENGVDFFKLDKVTWTVEWKPDDNKWTVTTPTGNIHSIDQYPDPSPALSSYYLRHNNTAKYMKIGDVPLVPDRREFLRIGCLEMTWTRQWTENDLANAMRVFRNTSIGMMKLKIRNQVNWTREIENLQIDHLKIETEDVTPDDIFDHLLFKKLEIKERFTTFEKFSNLCLKFKNGKMEIGSGYTAEFRDDWAEFWNELKEKLDVKCERLYFFKTTVDTPGCEMLVERWREGRKFMCRMQIIEKGKKTVWRTVKEFPAYWFSKRNPTFRSLFHNDVIFFNQFLLLFITVIFFMLFIQLVIYQSNSLLGKVCVFGFQLLVSSIQLLSYLLILHTSNFVARHRISRSVHISLLVLLFIVLYGLIFVSGCAPLLIPFLEKLINEQAPQSLRPSFDAFEEVMKDVREVLKTRGTLTAEEIVYFMSLAQNRTN